MIASRAGSMMLLRPTCSAIAIPDNLRESQRFLRIGEQWYCRRCGYNVTRRATHICTLALGEDRDLRMQLFPARPSSRSGR